MPDRANIVEVVSRTVELEQRGASWVGLCPFHNEKTPSLSVNRKAGVFCCFGCGESGNVVDWVCKVEGCSRDEAVRGLVGRHRA